MKTIKTTINTTRSYIGSMWVFRLSSMVLLCAVLLACETTPGKPSSSGSRGAAAPTRGLAGASEMYHAGNYAAAIREFDAIISAGKSDANSRRLAHLGKVLIYLGTDNNWHSLENAKMSLIAAAGLAAGGAKFALETDMLMDAISVAIGAESEHQQLQAKSSRASLEVVQLRRQNDALLTERDELRKEQKVLNEALEKLKNLTLGN